MVPWTNPWTKVWTIRASRLIYGRFASQLSGVGSRGRPPRSLQQMLPNPALRDSGGLLDRNGLPHILGCAGRVDDRDVIPGVRLRPGDASGRTQAKHPPGVWA